MNLDSYQAAAENRAKHRIASRIFNDSLAHANILVDAMLRHARIDEDLYIYSGSLPQGTYHHLLTCQARSIHILVDDASHLDWLLKASDRPKLEVFQIKQPRINHFLLTTGGFFRFEKDKSKFDAEANFNEPSVCAVLLAAFQRYLIDASPVEMNA